MMEPKAKFGFVAALDREVAGLVAGWKRELLWIDGIGFPCFRSEGRYASLEAAVCIAGTGVERAQRCTKVLIESFAPQMIISIGFVGALASELTVGSVLVPEIVASASTGEIYRTKFGAGVLATAPAVAGPKLKGELATKFRASAVDMEAAGVAEIASSAGTEFATIKAVSDEAGEKIDFLAPFVKPSGFDTGRFIRHIMVRPALWGAVGRLQRNSRRAGEALHRAVTEFLEKPEEFARQWSPAKLGQVSDQLETR